MRGFGVGFDLPWGQRGFSTSPLGRDQLDERVARYLASEHGHDTVFGSFQPKGRGWLDMADYEVAWDDFATHTARFATRTLHHTMLNLGSVENYDRVGILAITNELIDRHGFAWVNEDLGLWSLRGHPLAYPLPPLLTEGGLAAAIHNVDEVQAQLHAPLLVEFPGFSDGASLVIGPIDAYDFLRRLAEATGVGVTLDVGHLLSWRWLAGERGEGLFEQLERLPLDHCVEIHLSGCSIVGDRFHDDHRGVLLDQQFELLERLLPRCPALRVVTYEDPALTEDGSLAPECRASHARLRSIVECWSTSAPAVGSVPPAIDLVRRPPDPGEALAIGLERLLFAREAWPDIDAGVAAGIHGLLVTELAQRSHRGCGTLTDRFPQTIEAWRNRTADDLELRGLFASFLASPEHAGHRELPFVGVGTSLEDAFGRFAERLELGEPDVREAEHLAAVILALLIDGAPAFELPRFVRPTPRGYYAVSRANVLYAALDGRYVTGPLTVLLAELLRRPDQPERVAAEAGADSTTLATLLERLALMGLH